MPPKPFALETYFTIIGVLGTGMLGKVRLVQHKKSRKFFALKSMKKDDILRKDMLRHIENERLCLITLKHPFVAKYFGSFQSPSYIHLVMEYVPGGELFRRLQTVRQFSVEETKFYATEIVALLDFLHEKKFIYRDLKPENIMIDYAGHIKLIDFGFAKSLNSIEERCTTSLGTPQYLAPELLTISQDRRHYSQAVDWWAFACVLYEMLVGRTPFTTGKKHESSFEVYTRVIKGSISWPRSMPSDLKDLLKKMLQPDVSKRLYGGSNVKKHPYFADIPWQSVNDRTIEPPFIPVIKKEGDYSQFDVYPDSDDEENRRVTSSSSSSSRKNSLGIDFRNF
jgi:serine/threonine protein kinase